MEKGFFFIATGHPYFARAAARCAESIRENSGPVHISICTDSDEECLSAFDKVLPAQNDPERPYCSKVVNMARSPYEKTLFLDADTLVLRPVEQIFGILNHFDIAMPHSFHRGDRHWFAEQQFPGLSCLSSSMIAFRRNETTLALLEAWKASYLEISATSPRIGDQGILSIEVYRSGARLYVTTPEQHFHIGLPSAAHGEIRIVTGEKQDMLDPQLMTFLNNDTGFRNYLPCARKIGLMEFNDDGRTSKEVTYEQFKANEES